MHEGRIVTPSRLLLVTLLACFALLPGAGPGRAEELTGTLKKAQDTGAVTIGFRESSLPFSYLPSGAKQPIGYAIDICREIVDDMGKTLGRPLEVRFKPVTSESRFKATTSGEVDLECGSTTANAERRAAVEFSPVTFVSSTRLLVKAGGPIRSYRDLGGKKVVVTAGTTNEAAVRTIVDRLKLNVTIVKGRDHAESFRMIASGEADAFALDDVLLYGLKAAAGAEGAKFTVLPSALSYEPYGIMYRKGDAPLNDLVKATFVRLAESREAVWIYDRWFNRRLPTGERLNIPMSDELTHFWEMQGLSSE